MDEFEKFRDNIEKQIEKRRKIITVLIILQVLFALFLLGFSGFVIIELLEYFGVIENVIW